LVAEGLAALARGWAVTPLRGKRPVLDAWQVGPVPSDADVRRWVGGGYNLGLRTGHVSGVVVVDHDPRHDDGTALPILPRTVTVRTGGGGHHYYFLCPANPPPNSSGRIHPGIDIKSERGQVVLPGSIHPDTGVPYAWAEGLDPRSVALAEIPPDLLALAARPAAVTPVPRALPEGLRPDVAVRVQRARAWLAKVPGAVSGEGGHDRTFYVACRVALGFDLDNATTLALLSEWNQTCLPPWAEIELRHKVVDALNQPGERGYMLRDWRCDDRVPTWAITALHAAGVPRVVVPRRVSRRTIALLNTGTDARYVAPEGGLDGARAVFAASMSLLAAGLPEGDVARALALSALRRVIDQQGDQAARWLARRVLAARRALERPQRRSR